MKEYAFDETFVDQEKLRYLCDQIQTPFFLYDAETIRRRAAAMGPQISFCRFLPQVQAGAVPNPHLLHIFCEAGYSVICISDTEVQLARLAGFSPEKTTVVAHNLAELPLGVGNYILEDPAQLELLPACFTGTIGLRLNPSVRTALGRTYAVSADRMQFGMREEPLIDMAKQVMKRGAPGVGLHCQLGVSHLEEDYAAAMARFLFGLAIRLKAQGIPVLYCDLGGGISWSSQPQVPSPRVEAIAAHTYEAWSQLMVPAGLADVELRLQMGRYVMAPAGILVSRIVSVRHNNRTFLGLDASSSDMMRPMMRNTYHHISILGKNHIEGRQICDVTGWLQEPGDKLGERRLLPQAEPGDYCIVHDAGSYCQSMSTNYCGNLRCAEYLLDKEAKLIRRKETIEDYLSTIIPMQEA